MSGRMFGGESGSEDEEEDFGGDPVQGNRPTKLGSLFQGNQNDNGVSNTANLQYTAPKQPTIKEHKVQERKRESTPAPSEGGQPKLLFHTPVHAFALKDGQFIPQGKVGLALIAAPGKKEVKMLLYMSNKQPLSQTVIGADFQTQVQKDNYILFKDDRGFQWSIAFENSEKLLSCLQWVLAVRSSFLQDHDKDILTVDVTEGEGQELTMGDSVEMEYQEYLIEPGPSFTGWEKGIIGMRKGGKRLFLLPPDIGYSGHDSSPTFPTDTPIMVLIHVKRVRFSRAATPRDRSQEIENQEKGKPGLEKKPSLDSNISESNYSTSNAQESQTHTPPGGETGKQEPANPDSDKKKADLVSRMARIGQPTVFLAETPHPHTESTKETGQNLPNLPDFHEETSDSRKNSWEKPVPGKKPNPNLLAIVCADLSLSRSGSMATTANQQASQQENKAVTTPSPAEQPQNGPVMPFMYPYPHNPYLGQFYSGVVPSAGQQITSWSKGGTGQSGQGGAPPQHQPIPVIYPYPPHFTAGLQPLGGHESAGKIDSEEIIDEIHKSHMQLQDAVTKVLTQNLTAFKNQMAEVSAKLDGFEKLGKNNSELAVDSTSDPTSSQTSDVLERILEKLDTIQHDISELKSGARENDSTPQENLSLKLDSLGNEIRSLNQQENDQHPDVLSKLSSIETQMASLSEEVSRGNEWKEKYEKLKSQALLIKDKYEERINLLTEQLHTAQRDSADKWNEEAKIKKIMSQFYKSANSRFTEQESYESQEIKKIVLELVKSTTLQVLRGDTSVSEPVTSDLQVDTEKLSVQDYSPIISPVTNPDKAEDQSEIGRETKSEERSESPVSAEGSAPNTESMESFYSTELTPEREIDNLASSQEMKQEEISGQNEDEGKEENEVETSESMDRSEIEDTTERINGEN